MAAAKVATASGCIAVVIFLSAMWARLRHQAHRQRLQALALSAVVNNVTGMAPTILYASPLKVAGVGKVSKAVFLPALAVANLHLSASWVETAIALALGPAHPAARLARPHQIPPAHRLHRLSVRLLIHLNHRAKKIPARVVLFLRYRPIQIFQATRPCPILLCLWTAAELPVNSIGRVVVQKSALRRNCMS